MGRVFYLRGVLYGDGHLFQISTFFTGHLVERTVKRSCALIRLFTVTYLELIYLSS